MECQGELTYEKVCSSIRLLGSKVLNDLQGSRNSRNKSYDLNFVDNDVVEGEGGAERAMTASAGPSTGEEMELDYEYVDAMAAIEDADALAIQCFEEELESFMQETPELFEAMTAYQEARQRLLQKRRSRGFWPVPKGAGKNPGRFGKGRSKGKPAREQLLARMARSTCRACGERGHWKAECPKFWSSGEYVIWLQARGHHHCRPGGWRRLHRQPRGSGRIGGSPGSTGRSDELGRGHVCQFQPICRDSEGEPV